MAIDAPSTPQSWALAHGLDTGPIPATGYTSKPYFDREMERIWNRTWLVIGKLHQIPNPGDYFVKALPWAKTSLIVARGRDGAVRAFHNVCAHRCNRVVWDDCGTAELFRCSYHGWSYGTDGRLLKMTDEESFFGLDPQDHGLTPVHLDTWKGFIFVNLADAPPETLADYLGDFGDYLGGYPYEEFTEEYIWTAEVNCNWKVARDANGEIWHLPTLHARSFGKAFGGKDNPWNRATSFAASNGHCQMSATANPDYNPNPMEIFSYLLSLQAGTSVMDPRRQGQFPGGVNPAGDPFWQSDGNFIFPSIGLFPFTGFYGQVQWWPVAVDRCVYEVRHCYRPASNASERWVHEVGNITMLAGTLEDVHIMEPMQMALESGAKKAIVLSDQEFCIRNSHTWGQKVAGPYPEV